MIKTLVWLYRDLRLEDNEALFQAAACGQVIPFYIHDEEEKASSVWLQHSLEALKKRFEEENVSFQVHIGSCQEALKRLLKETKATQIFWNKRAEPHLIQRDIKLKKKLESQGIFIQIFESNYLIDPFTFLNQSGSPYTVFTPFYQAFKKRIDIPAPLPKPTFIPFKHPPSSFNLFPKKTWHHKLEKFWLPGRKNALKRLKLFIDEKLPDYATDRNFPAIDGTSLLSMHIHFGEISVREILHSLPKTAYSEVFYKQIIWREFAHYFLSHFPTSITESWKETFRKFPWKKDQNALRQWQQGLTGYPLIDAAMRQLWQTGWMHNRLRMIVASFLVKDLLQPWQEGAKWFENTLLDRDVANNTLGWQWCAGSGPDAAPYFRIFNPVLQSQKFDPKGIFIRKFLPELSRLPDNMIHAPWEHSPEELRKYGVFLGKNYPLPLVNHQEARKFALQAYKKIKS